MQSRTYPSPAAPRELGACYRGNGITHFTFWHPQSTTVSLHLHSPNERFIPMERQDPGYWHVRVDSVAPGSRYTYLLDRGQGPEEHPDPASRSQPDGVHGPSAVVDLTAFSWQDQDWQGLDRADLIFYEVHVGTFTPEGTFAAIIPRLPRLRSLGITALELMPLAHFPGDRNWGYDGVFPFAVHHTYGGIGGLGELINACHGHGIAVFIDVVYNHLGPEGNYLWGLGNYFTDQYHTPWGNAINYDGAHSDGVREYFFANAQFWIRDLHADGLRLDAIQAIYDCSAYHFLQELQTQISGFANHSREVHLIAESDLNDPKVIAPLSHGGYGLSAQWSDDFHHTLHVVLTGENHGYYSDYVNNCPDSSFLHPLMKTIREGFLYQGSYSQLRQHRHGAPAAHFSPQCFVIATQNHDQVGNRMMRLCHLVPFEKTKLAAATLLLTPGLPLLFMGEEYGETAPFYYFTSHSDRQLIENVRAGRKREFADFHLQGEPPDPQAVETFSRSKVNWELQNQPPHSQLWCFYQRLLHLRTTLAVLKHPHRDHHLTVFALEDVLVMQFSCGTMNMPDPKGRERRADMMAFLNFTDHVKKTSLPGQGWDCQIDSAVTEFGGDRPVPNPQLINPWGVLVFIRDSE